MGVGSLLVELKRASILPQCLEADVGPDVGPPTTKSQLLSTVSKSEWAPVNSDC